MSSKTAIRTIRIIETPSVLAAPPPPLEATSSQARLLAAIAVVMLLIGYTLYRLLGSA